MALLQRIDEETISSHKLYGDEINIVEGKIKGLIDIAMDKKTSNIDFDFFDLKGTVLLHGIPGIGKSSVMANCLNYALENYGVDCYELIPSNIIVADLGKATKNLTDALKEFEDKEKGVLFIDEIDRLCVNRRNDEISELKRMLIELMQFFDRQKASNKKVILCCTNVFDQIDTALIRRFSICERIHEPSETELVEFANICLLKAKMTGKIERIKDCSVSSFDDVKRTFRNTILMGSKLSDCYVLEDE